MDTMLTLLGKIRNRPEIYLGRRDIHRLRAFLGGYSSACCQTVPGYDDEWLWEGFRIWLSLRYGDRRSSDWAALIADNEPGGQSTDAFFRLLDEYFWSPFFPYEPERDIAVEWAAHGADHTEADRMAQSILEARRASGWQCISGEDDIDRLVRNFGGLCDVYLSEAHYDSGDRREESRNREETRISAGGLIAKKLLLTFYRAEKPSVLRMCFTGVRRFRFNPYKVGCDQRIGSAYIGLHSDLLGTETGEQLICWADDEGFDPLSWNDQHILRGSNHSFVIANQGEWKISDQ